MISNQRFALIPIKIRLRCV